MLAELTRNAGLRVTRVALAALAFAALAATFGPSRAVAAGDGDEGARADDADAADASADAGPLAPLPAALPPPEVTLSGPVDATMGSGAEATTTWKYGRGASDKRVDESATHLRVSGAARTADGLSVGFSAVVYAPSLRPGTTYRQGSAVDAQASAWGRRESASLDPDIVWEAGAAPAELAVTVTAMAEMSHAVERRGSLVTEVTRWAVHGAVEATLPCVRSAAPVRTLCKTATLRGTF